MLLSGSVLVVGGAESFQSGNWIRSTVQRQPQICWIASVQKRFAYAALSLFLRHSRHESCRSCPPQAPPSILWFSAKSIQCCIGQVLHSTLKKHAYRETVGSTLSYSTVQSLSVQCLVCAVSRSGLSLGCASGILVPQHQTRI